MSSAIQLVVTGITAFFGETAVLDDALTDAALGLDSELLADCIAGAHTDVVSDNLLLSGAVSTLQQLLPGHLREWVGAADVIANLIAPRASIVFAECGA